jgi:hypothetical protein
MAEAEGWIKLYRKLMINDLWIKEPFTRGQAWVDLLLLANHKDGFIRIRGIKIPVLRGQVGWSERKLGDRWKWSRGKVKRFISELQNEKQIDPQKNNETSIITIVNYDLYQENRPQNEPQNERQEEQGHKQATNGPQTGHKTGIANFNNDEGFEDFEIHKKNEVENENVQKQYPNKNNKNNKNIKKKDNRAFAPPSLEQVIDYCNERRNGVNPQKWYNFYLAKGWMVGKNKMKDWQAAVRTWEESKPKQQSGLDYLERMAKGDD